MLGKERQDDESRWEASGLFGGRNSMHDFDRPILSCARGLRPESRRAPLVEETSSSQAREDLEDYMRDAVRLTRRGPGQMPGA